jgi:hypothetical protein
VDLILNSSEESKKVTRQGGDNKMGEKYWAVFQRVEDPFIKLEKNTPSEV